jgi:hypothetical protein
MTSFSSLISLSLFFFACWTGPYYRVLLFNCWFSSLKLF